MLAPHLAFAAWWNPFTWRIFSHHPNPVRQSIPQSPTPATTQSKPAPAVSGKHQTLPLVTSLKTKDPQQFNKLINENKIQLLEASKILSNKKIIARVKPAVVYVETDTGSGSGMIIDADGYILTNAHVVMDANSATIKLTDGRPFLGNVVGRDENIDVALIKIDANGLPIVALGDSDSIEQGDPVFTMGYPLGIEGDVDFKDGTLSRRQNIKGVAYLEISAQILPGNSGGPLVNQSGEVIGINTLAIGKGKLGGTLIGETLKFALPINVAKDLIPQLKNGRHITVPKSISSAIIPVPIPQQPAIPPTQPPAPPSPIISSIEANAKTNSATISWRTNYPESSSKIEYGVESNLASPLTTPSAGYVSLAFLSGLTPGTKHYYRIISMNSSGQETRSEVRSFTTLPASLIISDVQATNFEGYGGSMIRISWLLHGHASSLKLEYSTDKNLIPAMTYKGLFGEEINIYDQKLDISIGAGSNGGGLSPGTTYYFRLVGVDDEGNTVRSDIQSLTTRSDIQSLTTTGVATLSVSLTPDNPSSADVVVGSKNAAFLKLRFSASNDGDIKLTGIIVAKYGNCYSQSNNMKARAYIDSTLVSDDYLYSNSADTMNFNSTIIIPAGGHRDVEIKADILSGPIGACAINLFGYNYPEDAIKAKSVTTTNRLKISVNVGQSNVMQIKPN